MMRVCWCLIALSFLSSASAQQAGWCGDTMRWCWDWALQGECFLSRPFMARHCSASCGFCVDSKCVDRNKLCPLWTSSGGCSSSSRVVVSNCPLSCGACAPASQRPPFPALPGNRDVQPQPDSQRQPQPGRQPLPSGGFPARFPTITRPSFKCGTPYSAPGSGRRARQVSSPSESRVTARPTATPKEEGITGLADESSGEGNVFCGATVISDRFLLTAAHCVINNPVYSVRLGDLDLSQDNEPNSRPQDYEVEVIYVHPDYDGGYNDLALIKTARRIEFNEGVFPFCISDSRPNPQATVTGAGFGYVNETSKASHLQEVELKVVASAECESMFLREHSQTLRKWYPQLLQGSDIMCAGAPGKSACKGDGGGPLYKTDTSGRQFLVGIISRGLPCGDTQNITMPSFYISVADHVDFINSVVYEEF
ncbi:phenoloxidase-activating factor 3-like isoform X2 [Penaeus japonicus]|uniref:phenoloxidase-activating factor 3-like isoform X2 n=1 Tax=Penaeus japonicus TaxID=27405 RepID=UPI001C70F740|nr:phenoloxidase-activating factor 3-like isoform X2 [Penaeus japonicus]